MRGAKVIVEDCANVKKREKALIITDFETENCAQLLVEMA